MNLLEALVSRIGPKLSLGSDGEPTVFPQTKIMRASFPEEGADDLFCFCVDDDLRLLGVPLLLTGVVWLLTVLPMPNVLPISLPLFFSAAPPGFP